MVVSNVPSVSRLDSNKLRRRTTVAAVVDARHMQRRFFFPLFACAAAIHPILCFLIVPTVAFASPYYSAYSQQLPYPSYRSSYGVGNNFYAKPSYAFVSPYSGNGAYGMGGNGAYGMGNAGAAGLSAYEGPSYGMNTYWQPGVAYSPYGAYGGSAATTASGYGGGVYGGGGGPLPYGMGAGAYGDMCRDRSANCPMSASPLYPPLSPYYGYQSNGHQLANADTGYGYGTVYNHNGGGGGYGSVAAGGGYSGCDPCSVGVGYGAPLGGGGVAGYGAGATTAPAGPSFACRDSHLYGCQQWAAQGLCQQTPEYMTNYCRASCDVCNSVGGAIPPPAGGVYGSPYGGAAYGTGGGGPATPAGGTVFGGPNAFNGGLPPPYSGVGGGIPPPEYGVQAGFGALDNHYVPPAAAPAQFGSMPLPPAYQMATDPYGTNLSGGVSPTAPLSALNSMYSPFSPYRSLHSAATVANQRREEKQKKGAKVLFSEDTPTTATTTNGNEPNTWPVGGLPPASSASIFEQPAAAASTRMPSSALFNNANEMPNWSPFSSSSSLSTPQLSSGSKLVKMDDLVLDKAKTSRKAKN